MEQTTLRSMLDGPEPVFAPLVLNPLMARLAERAGFPALYLGGGSLGYVTCFTEANLTVTEMAQAALDIRAACSLPLILDGACGWGDPMHMRRTIPLAEAAGFAAIEIEDQLLPKRAHHHVGIEHIIPLELMVAKVEEAVRARRSPDFLIIARTNAARQKNGLDEALRRGEAMRKAGADILLVLPGKPGEARIIGESLAGPKMFMMSGSRLTDSGMTVAELAGLGYRLFVDPTTPLMVMHRALRQCYAAMKAGQPDPLIGTDTRGEQHILHETIDLETLLEIERRTVER
jgi:2-methylisocitrate lyase-like PEP mutase family enzyme